MSEPTYPSSRHDRPHVRLYAHWLNQPPWKNLSPHAFKILSMLMAEYRPDKPNLFPVGARRIAEMCGCSSHTAKKSIDELIECVFLHVQQKGRNRGNAHSRERIVSLTRYDTETSKGDPELPIKVWRRKTKSEHLKSAA